MPNRLSENQIIRFRNLAYAQRKEPEEAMHKAVHLLGASDSLSYLLEHVGDLTNRMSKDLEFGYAGYDTVRDKVDHSLSTLKRPSFEREQADYMNARAKHLGMSNKEFDLQIAKAMVEYAVAHAKLKVYNRAQKLAQLAAVEIGSWRFSSAYSDLKRLKEMLDDEKSWWTYATEDGT